MSRPPTYNNSRQIKSYLGYLGINRDIVVSEASEREIIPNYPDLNLPSNKISTSLYNKYNIFPKFLLIFLSNPINLYFLMISVMQMTPVSSSDQHPLQLMPLFLVLIIGFLHFFLKDKKNKEFDRSQNSKIVKKLKPNSEEFEYTSWENIYVGNIIRIEENQCFPADILMLKSSNSNGEAFIDTFHLDGNYKSLIKKRVNKDLEHIHEYNEEQVLYIY